MYNISIFYFTLYLFGGAYAPNAPPAYGPDVSTGATCFTSFHTSGKVIGLRFTVGPVHRRLHIRTSTAEESDLFTDVLVDGQRSPLRLQFGPQFLRHLRLFGIISDHLTQTLEHARLRLLVPRRLLLLLLVIVMMMLVRLVRRILVGDGRRGPRQMLQIARHSPVTRRLLLLHER